MTRRPWLSAALAALAIAACGGDSGPAAQSTAPVASPTAGSSLNVSGTSATPTPVPLLGSVKSADGAARVDVPVGSLPAGMRVEDIRVADIDPESLPITFPDGPVLAAYRLEPDGAKFPQPVTFSVTVPSKGASLPGVVMISGEEVSAALGVDVTFDAATASMIVSAQIDHFSHAAVVEKAFFQLVMVNQPDRLVSETFHQAVVIAIEQNAYRMVAKTRVTDVLAGLDETALIKLNGVPRLEGTFVAKTFNLTPLTQVRPTPAEEMNKSAVRYEVTFTCRDTGIASIAYEARLSVPTTWERTGFRGFRFTETTVRGEELVPYTITIVGAPFQCRAALPPAKEPPKADVRQNDAPPNYAPVVSRMNARNRGVLNSAHITDYSVKAFDPDGDILDVVWDPLPCGAAQPDVNTLQGSGEAKMAWIHVNRDCHSMAIPPAAPGSNEPHPEHTLTVVKVTITDRSLNPSPKPGESNWKRHWSVTCTYVGVTTGTGADCDAGVEVDK